MIRKTMLIACAAVAAAGGVHAQAPQRAPQAGGFGTIQGVVYDSLLGGPLPGAYVSLLDGSRGALADQRGRFTLDSVRAGRRVLTFSHADLDSIGLTSLAATVTVSAGRATVVQLAVPSHETFRLRVCESDGAGRDSGVVFGNVTDARSRSRLAGARVVVSWPAVSRERSGDIVLRRPYSQARTDSLGSYYVCGAPAEYVVTAQADAGRFSSGTIEVLIGPRGIARQDLSVSRDSAGADSVGNPVLVQEAAVAGTVSDERGPVVGAYVTMDDVVAVAPTARDGSFLLQNLPAGSRMLMVRHVGYFAWRTPVSLRNEETLRLTVPLRAATVLDTLRVVASPHLAAELDDMQRRIEAGFGYFLSSAEILQHTNVRSLFEGLPSVSTQGHSVNDFVIQMRGLAGNCLPSIFLDGMMSDVAAIVTLQPRNLAAVEVYPRMNPGLYKYMMPGNQECGIVLFWTKYAR